MSHGHSDHEHHPHVLPYRVYISVWLGLLVLTVITVSVSYIDLGSVNIGAAMLIAAVKGSLVCLFFMHLKYDDRFNSSILLAAFGFLALLFIFILADIGRRGEVDPLEAGTIKVLPEFSIPHQAEEQGNAGEAGGEENPGHGQQRQEGSGSH